MNYTDEQIAKFRKVHESVKTLINTGTLERAMGLACTEHEVDQDEYMAWAADPDPDTETLEAMGAFEPEPEGDFTPGEWNVSNVVNDIQIYADSGSGRGGRDIALVYQNSRGIPEKEAQANARVMAASKDLLAALEAMYEAFNGYGDTTSPACKQAREAISKARY